MADKKGIIGGFIATNSGQIEDCYCLTKFSGKQMTAGGFVGENKGKIVKSFCQAIATKLSGGFCGKQSDLSGNCYYVSDKKKNDDFWDNSHQLDTAVFEREDTAKSAGFDTDKIWECNDGEPSLHFNNDTWFYNASENKDKKPIVIKSAENLFKFADLVNSGDKSAINAYVVLGADIDLKGKSWTPIGTKRENAFAGVFDGNGFCIKNLIIKSNDFFNKGFFGYLRGSVYNLEIDCLIKGDGVIGGIAAVNEGTIGCCGVTIQCTGKGHDFSIGGLSGVNSGRIFRSFAAGTIKFAVVSIVPILILLCAGTIATAAVLSVKSYVAEDDVYKELPSDPDQHRYEDDEIVQATEAIDDELSTISFTIYENIDIDRKSGQCGVDFINPGKTTSKLVIKLMIDKDSVTDAFGGVVLDEDDYDGKTGRVIIAESGAISPGNMLDYVYLSENARKTLYPGTFKGFVVLCAYDGVTNELKGVQTELPVTLDIR